MQRSYHKRSSRYQPQGSRSRSPARTKYSRDDSNDNDRTQKVCWWWAGGAIVAVAAVVLGIAFCRHAGPAPPPPEPPKPSRVPDPELVRICNHHHKIYHMQPYYTENLDLFEVLGLDARSPVFGPSKRNGRATAQDDARAEGAIQDAIMAQVERNLDENMKRGKDGGGASAAATRRRIVVDTGLLLQNDTIRKLYIDGFVPVKEKSRNGGSEKWLGRVCNNFEAD